MAQRYSHLAPGHLRAAVERLVTGTPEAPPARAGSVLGERAAVVPELRRNFDSVGIATNADEYRVT